MNDEQHAFWLAYIRHLADLLGLKDWRIELERQYTNDSEAVAACRVWPNQRGASISLTDWFLKQYTAAEQRETVAHELFHCHDYRLRCLVHEYADKDESDAGKLFLSLFEREYEQLCDGMAVAVAEFLPLPENRPNPLPDDEIFGWNPGIVRYPVAMNGATR